ncbi:MAG: hypothetical protein AAGH42_08890 [Pseudomonadota bacterium]
MTIDMSGTFSVGTPVEFVTSLISGITYFSTEDGVVYSIDQGTENVRAEYVIGG